MAWMGRMSFRSPLSEAAVHFLVLLALFTLSFRVLGFSVGGTACILILIVHVLWCVLSAKQIVIGAGSTRPGYAVFLLGAAFALLYLVMGLDAIKNVSIPVFAVLALISPDYDVFSIMTSNADFLSIMLLTLAVTLVAAVLTLACLIGGRSGSWRELAGRLGKRWPVFILGQMLIAVPFGAAFMGISIVAGGGAAIGALAAELGFSWGESVVSTFLGYPIMILAVTGAAAALAPLRGLARWYARSLALAIADGEEDTGLGKTAPWRVAMLILCLAFGAFSAPFTFAKIVRSGMVAALSGANAVGFVFGTEDAIRLWVKTSSEKGANVEALVRQLNSQGRWSSEQPDGGLSKLIPDFAAETGKLAADIQCALNVSAGTLPKEWQPASKDEGSDAKALPLRYCLKTVCRAETLAERGDVTFLFSSHGSRRDGWRTHMATTMVFGPPSPGGFCTRSGEVAAEYQG